MTFSIDYNLEKSREILSCHSIDPHNSCLCSNHIYDISVDLQIIIPCYNVKDHIEKCLLSVLNQRTKYSYKITAIDDGSVDGTSTLLDKYANDERIQIIHQDNRGLSGARNRGLDTIIGKYITFLDSDDTLEQNAIEEWMNAAYRDGSDIVEGSFVKLRSNKRIEGRMHKNETNVLYNNLYGFPWGKIFNAQMFQNIQFPEHYWFEDTLCTYILFPMARKITTINTTVYCYLINPLGINARCKKSDKSIDSHWITEQLLKDAEALRLINENNINLYYEHTINQIAINYTRTMFRGRDVRHAIFVLSCNLLTTYFPNCTTKRNDTTKKIELAIRNKNYFMFVFSVIKKKLRH